MNIFEFLNLKNDVNQKMFDFEGRPNAFIWNHDEQRYVPSNSIMFDKTKWKPTDTNEDKSMWHDFFGNTPATAMQGAGSMLAGIGGVWDAYNRNKWQKKAYNLEKAAIDRQLDRERRMDNTLHSVWGNK